MIPIDSPAYTLRFLDVDSMDAVQNLCEACADFFQLVEGNADLSGAGRSIFEELPPGRPIADKFVYGLFNHENDLLGVLEGMRHYPDGETWWIGLLVITPTARGHGLGQRVMAEFFDQAHLAGATAIQLGVVEANQEGYRFWQKMGFNLLRTTEPRRFGEKLQAVNVMRRNLG